MSTEDGEDSLLSPGLHTLGGGTDPYDTSPTTRPENETTWVGPKGHCKGLPPTPKRVWDACRSLRSEEGWWEETTKA